MVQRSFEHQQRLVTILFTFGLLLLASCGGGGGDDGPVAQPPPCNAAARVCYVSTGGSDSNTGADPGDAFASIRTAAQRARDDYMIVVQAGTYRGEVTTTVVGEAPKRLQFRASGRVVVDVQNVPGAAGFSLSNSDDTLIDGFTVIGAADAGIVIKSGSDRFVIRNCTLARNPGDGIRIQDSGNVLIFNNLVYNNSGIGIRIGGVLFGSSGAQIINNTIYGNGGRGIEIGTSQTVSPSAVVLNNIVQVNSQNSTLQDNIKVETSPPSYVGYRGNHNLVFPPVYVPSGQIGIRGPNDVNAEARFVNPAAEDFRLQLTSPAINAGDPLTDRIELRRDLRSRTTTGTSLDSEPIDIGYHFP